jgi:hypothetical protein
VRQKSRDGDAVAGQKHTDAVTGQKAKDPFLGQKARDHTTETKHSDVSLPRKPKKLAEGSKTKCTGNQTGSAQNSGGT